MINPRRLAGPQRFYIVWLVNWCVWLGTEFMVGELLVESHICRCGQGELAWVYRSKLFSRSLIMFVRRWRCLRPIKVDLSVFESSQAFHFSSLVDLKSVVPPFSVVVMREAQGNVNRAYKGHT